MRDVSPNQKGTFPNFKGLPKIQRGVSPYIKPPGLKPGGFYAK